MSRTLTHRIAPAAVALTVAGMSGCAGSDAAWGRVELAGDGEIVALATVADGMLVGRYDTLAQTRSSVQKIDRATGSVRPALLVQGAGYAAEARLVSISGHEGQIVALGTARGGAHGNPRWTVWAGDANGLREQPQTFETFGGWDAGGLASSAYGRGGPILVGSWRAQSEPGFDICVWRLEGDRWVRLIDPDPASRATRTRQSSVTAVTTAAGGYVAIGSTTVLGTRSRSLPTAWFANRPVGPWHEIPLPSSGGHEIAQANAISCMAEHCAIAGRNGADVVAWRLTLDGQAPTTSAPVPISHDVPQDAKLGVATAGPTRSWVAVSTGARLQVKRVSARRAVNAFEQPGTLTAMARGPQGRPYVAIVDPSGAVSLWRGPR